MLIVKSTELDQNGLKWNKMLQIKFRKEVRILMDFVLDLASIRLMTGFETCRVAAAELIGYNVTLTNAKHCFDKDIPGSWHFMSVTKGLGRENV